MNEPPISVLIVDDHPVVRAGLAAILGSQEDLRVVATAGNGAEAMARLREHAPDLGLVDLSLPDCNGADLIIRMRAERAAMRFIVLSARTGGADIERCLRAGAGAYLFKDAPHEELLAAVRSVARGGRYLPPAVGREAERVRLEARLTQRELAVLLQIARGRGNREIAQALGIGEETVKSHVKNLLDKLGAESRGQAVAHALRLGLVHDDDLEGERR